MEPELFRLNINQFLQTARTVTFLIQKDKDNLAEFDSIYTPIALGWDRDEVMRWAKDSRNKIEKEGDLELFSTLDLTLLYSYIAEQDKKLSTGRAELLAAGTKKLMRFARSNLPSGVLHAASIKIERKWIANSLPKIELLRACDYVYSTLYHLCGTLKASLGERLESTILDPTDLLASRDKARQVRYLRLSDMSSRVSRHERIFRDPEFIPPPVFLAADLGARFGKLRTTEEVFDFLVEMVEMTFARDGYHITMLHLFDSDLNVVDMISTEFADQGDKFIFWRDVADRVASSKAFAMSFISEAWIRDMRRADASSRISDLPIIGEQLILDVLDRSGKFLSAIWTIERIEGQPPKLVRNRQEQEEKRSDTAFVYAPVLRAFGLEYPAGFDQPSLGPGRRGVKAKGDGPP